MTHYPLVGGSSGPPVSFSTILAVSGDFFNKAFFQPNGCAKVEEEIRKFVSHLIPQHFPKGELLSSTFIVIHNGSRIVKQTSFEGISRLWSPFVVLI